MPLRQQGQLVGALNARRTDVRPFTPAQIKLLETFADQAVIAHRERAAVSRTQGVAGAADGDERDSGRHRQLADGHPAGVWMRSPRMPRRLCDAKRCRDSSRWMVTFFGIAAVLWIDCREAPWAAESRSRSRPALATGR